MKKVTLNKLTIELIEPNILYLTLQDDVTIEECDVVEIKKVNLELTQGKEYVAIFENGKYSTITKEARELMTDSKIELNRKASAYIVYSLSQKLIGNFYLRVNKPKVPSKLFSDKKSALKWVKEILSQP